MLREFLNEKQTIINLPVPLGANVYKFTTRCNDACLFQKDEFQKIKGSGSCDVFLPCHVFYKGVVPVEMSLNNLEIILKNWGKLFFKTKEEAEKAGLELIEKNKKILIDNGLKVSTHKKDQE